MVACHAYSSRFAYSLQTDCIMHMRHLCMIFITYLRICHVYTNHLLHISINILRHIIYIFLHKHTDTQRHKKQVTRLPDDCCILVDIQLFYSKIQLYNDQIMLYTKLLQKETAAVGGQNYDPRLFLTDGPSITTKMNDNNYAYTRDMSYIQSNNNNNNNNNNAQYINKSHNNISSLRYINDSYISTDSISFSSKGQNYDLPSSYTGSGKRSRVTAGDIVGLRERRGGDKYSLRS